MLSCKDVTQLLSESMDASLPIGKRIGVRLHLLICKFCLRYKRQLLLIRETVRRVWRGRPKIFPWKPFRRRRRDRIRKSLANRIIPSDRDL